MFQHERHREILKLLDEKNSIRVNELSKLFSVTKATIRSDLNYLEAQRKLIRTHGGAVSIDDRFINIESSSYEHRKMVNIAKKKEISNTALNFINDNECIILDASSTCYELAKQLNNSNLKNLTIITNGLRTAILLKENPEMRVIIVGGSLRKDSNAIDSLLGVEILSKFIIDKAFVSSFSIDPKNGLTDFNLDEIDLKKEMIKNSDKTYALIDSSKFGLKSLAVFTPLQNLTAVITNKDPSKYSLYEEISSITNLIIT